MLRGKDGSDKYYSDMLIILDFDGTIGDSQALIIGTMQQTMRELKLEVKTKEECARTIGLRLDEVFQQLYGVCMTKRCTVPRLIAESSWR